MEEYKDPYKDEYCRECGIVLDELTSNCDNRAKGICDECAFRLNL